MRVRGLLYHSGSGKTETGGEELVARWQPGSPERLWVHVEGPVETEEVQQLAEVFQIHELALQDATRRRHPPKIEVFPDHTFLILKILSRDSQDIDCSTIQLALFVGSDFLFTLTSGPCPDIAALFGDLAKKGGLSERRPVAIATRIMRLSVDRYLSILFRLEPILENLEDGLMDRVDDKILAEVAGYKSDLKRLRRIFLYHEQILRELRSKILPGFTEESEHEVNDVYEQQERAGSLALLYYELASDLVEGYLSLSAHRLNQIMKVLTIVTTIFVPLGFLAGIYGMNFENMPELQSNAGYYVLLGVMAFIVVSLLTIFRFRKWL